MKSEMKRDISYVAGVLAITITLAAALVGTFVLLVGLLLIALR